MNNNPDIPHIQDAAKHTLDVVAAGTWVGAMIELLPAWAAIMSIIWLGLQIFGWFSRKGWRK